MNQNWICLINYKATKMKNSLKKLGEKLKLLKIRNQARELQQSGKIILRGVKEKFIMLSDVPRYPDKKI